MSLVIISLVFVYTLIYKKLIQNDSILLNIELFSFVFFFFLLLFPFNVMVKIYGLEEQEVIGLYRIEILVFTIFLISSLRRKVNFNLRDFGGNKTKLSSVGPFVIAVVSVFYLILALVEFYKFTGSFNIPFLYALQNKFNIVLFREYFWRLALPRIPASSFIRYFAKYGSLITAFVFFEQGKKFHFLVFLFLALMTFSIEGTKSSLMAIGVPLVLFVWFKRDSIGKVNKYIFTVVGITLIIGTIFFSYVEAGGDWKYALLQKTIYRIFLVPDYVAFNHYRYHITLGKFLWGATNRIVLALKGGSDNVFGMHVLDYDNLIFNLAYRGFNAVVTVPIMGSFNGPFFIYGYVNFGYIGVILWSLIFVIINRFVENLLKSSTHFYAFYSVFLWQVIMLITSQNLLDFLFGMEGLFPFLLIFYIFSSKSQKFRLTYGLIVYFTLAITYNVIDIVLTHIAK